MIWGNEIKTSTIRSEMTALLHAGGLCAAGGTSMYSTSRGLRVPTGSAN